MAIDIFRVGPHRPPSYAEWAAPLPARWPAPVACSSPSPLDASSCRLLCPAPQAYQSGLEMHTANATAAGFIMTALFDLVLLMVIGTTDAEAGCTASKQAGADGAARV
jgi:hypothetical protein